MQVVADLPADPQAAEVADASEIIGGVFILVDGTPLVDMANGASFIAHSVAYLDQMALVATFVPSGTE
jgi:hypothetical protein